jgi:hypothetical protein
VIPEIRLSATPLAEAVETLNRLSGADIKVDLPALQGAGIDPAMPVDMRLRNATLDQALTALLGYASGGNTTTLVYTLHGGGIVVTTDNALAPYTYAAVYDVRDISLPIEFQTPTDNTIQTSSDLFGDPAHTVLTRKEMDDEIARLLQELVAPDVWDTSGGNGGRISSVSGRLLVVASWQQHREIERLLSDLRATESR